MTKPLKRIPQAKVSDEGGRVVTPVRLPANVWRRVQRIANQRRVSASRLIAEWVEVYLKEPGNA
jgi:predicted DNA-binding ribbon-helix-helix protein